MHSTADWFFHEPAFSENLRKESGSIFEKCVMTSPFLQQAYLFVKFQCAETQ